MDKAAVLMVHLAQNHPLPDGNKRVAWVAMRLFLEVNGWRFLSPPDVDEAETAVLAVAAGRWRAPDMAAWLRERLVDGARDG